MTNEEIGDSTVYPQRSIIQYSARIPPFVRIAFVVQGLLWVHTNLVKFLSLKKPTEILISHTKFVYLLWVNGHFNNVNSSVHVQVKAQGYSFVNS